MYWDASPILLPICVYGLCLWLTPNCQKYSSKSYYRVLFVADMLAFLWYYLINVDGNRLDPFGGHLVWYPAVHGHDGVFPAYSASALGRIQQQILQRQRLLLHLLQFYEPHNQ